MHQNLSFQLSEEVITYLGHQGGGIVESFFLSTPIRTQSKLIEYVHVDDSDVDLWLTNMTVGRYSTTAVLAVSGTPFPVSGITYIVFLDDRGRATRLPPLRANKIKNFLKGDISELKKLSLTLLALISFGLHSAQHRPQRGKGC